MTDSLSAQYIRFACKVCGKIFSRVPYERIIQCRTAECSACKSRFTLDREEIQAALIDALSDALTEPIRDHAADTDTIYSNIFDIDEPQELDTFDNFDSEEPIELDAEDSLEIEESLELDAEDSLEIEESLELDAEDSLEIEESLELDAEDSLEIEESLELDAEDSLEIEESLELDAEDSLEIEESLELDAEDSLEIEESLELDAEDSLEIEESLELDAEDSLEIEESLELDAEDSLEIEESLELDAEDSLEIEESLELDAEDSLEIEESLESAAFAGHEHGMDHTIAAEDIQPAPEMKPFDADDIFDNDSHAHQHSAPPAADSHSQTPSRTKAGFEPEKEDKVEFARRLSRLIPEGWVNLSQESGNAAPPGTARSDSSDQDLQQVEGRHQFLVFALGEAEFAVPVENTTEIGMVPELTRLPHVPEWLLGITNLRGDIVSVVDMENFLGMGPFNFAGNDRIILLRSLQEDLCTAVIVNRIAGMQYVAEEDIIRPDAGQKNTEPHIRGVFEMDGRSIAVLDIESLLLSDDMQQFRAM